MADRYKDREILKNDNEIYKEVFRNRNVKFIRQFETPNFKYPSKSDFNKFDISTYILPKDNKFRNEIMNNISKKNIECHFIFENLICKSKNDFKKINVFFKLRNLLNFT
jgi:signal recognition particle subunit SEC65